MENQGLSEEVIEYKREESTEPLVAEGGKYLELEELLDNPTLDVAKRINKLFEFGITISMIKKLYSQIPKYLISKKEGPAKALEVVYKTLVMTINDLPNGIVINEETATKDEKACEDEKKRYGIDDFIGFSKKSEDILLSNIEKKEILDNAVIREVLEREEADRYINQNFSKKMCNLNVSSYKTRGKDVSEDEKFVTIETMDDAEVLRIFLQYKYNPEKIIGKYGDVETALNQYKKSKYYKLVLDSRTGKIDNDKVRKIGTKWIETQNRVGCQKYLKNALEMIKSSQGKFDPQTLDETQKKFFGVILARGYFAEDVESKIYFREICSLLGINTTEKDVVNMVNSLVHATIRNESDLAKHKAARRGVFKKL